MARLTVYNAAVHERIVKALRVGSSKRDAAGFAGVDWHTFVKWLKAGRRWNDGIAEGSDERYAKLADDVDQSASENKVALRGFMYAAAEGTPAKRDANGKVVKERIPGDWRAGEALLKFQRGSSEHRATVRKMKADATVSEKRAAGTLPPTQIDVKDERATKERIRELLRKAGMLADAGGDGGTGVPSGDSGGPQGDD